MKEKKTWFNYMLSIRDRFEDTDRWNVKGWENTYHANNNQKRAEVTLIMSDKIEFKTKINRDK